jgi:D-threo-aldose 1-dehydrogenase
MAGTTRRHSGRHASRAPQLTAVRLMQAKRLGRTELEVSVVGLGTMFLGMIRNGRPYREAEMDEDVGVAAVHAAVEAGCTLIDTAPLYGYGQAERILGRAFRERPDLRARCLVATKVGYLPKGFDYTYDMTMRCIEGSQERLGLDRLELVCIHDARGVRMRKVLGRKGALKALRKLQDEGVVRWVGSATNHPPTNADYVETGEFDAAVLTRSYSLLNLDARERMLPAAERHDVGLVIAMPLERGLLATGPVQGAVYMGRSFSRACLDHVAEIQSLCAGHGVRLAAAALQWCVRHPQVTATIPGARTAEEAVANARVGATEVPESFWADLEPLVKHWPQGVDR